MAEQPDDVLIAAMRLVSTEYRRLADEIGTALGEPGPIVPDEDADHRLVNRLRFLAMEIEATAVQQYDAEPWHQPWRLRTVEP